jgi:hypothetical protein
VLGARGEPVLEGVRRERGGVLEGFKFGVDGGSDVAGTEKWRGSGGGIHGILSNAIATKNGRTSSTEGSCSKTA